jgi:cell division protein FtsQ
LEANYKDFLEQFTEIEHERRTLMTDRSRVTASIRAEQSRRARRFWSSERKKSFNEARLSRIAELRKEIERIDVLLAAQASNRNVLREKEKKSVQSHHFLTKLVNFVRSIESDDFWSAEVVQINVLGSSAGGGSNTWQEPQLELVPRVGNHIVLLGKLDGGEFDRLDKLKTFYLGGLWHEGWNEFRYINIKYKDQVVCSK